MIVGQPLVSVITPTYKRSEYIKRALDSILGQTYRNIEIVLVDDNIPDSEFHKNTLEKLSPYLENPGIRYIKTSGAIGGGAARNLGIKHCGGEYVAFLDDDDRFLPEKIEKQLEFTQANGLDMSYQDIQWHDEDDKLVEYRKMDRVRDFTREGLLRAHITYSIAPTSIYMIRRDALVKTQGFGEVKRGQDFILMLRCIETGLKIGYMSGAYVVQYLHSGERISVGEQFIAAQTEIYNLMKQYEHILSPKERRYVDFRYNAVCAFSSARGGRFTEAVSYAARSFCVSPASFLSELKRYFGGRSI